MSFIFIKLFFYLLSLFQQKAEVTYSIRPSTEEQQLAVKMTFQGNESGLTEIILPSSYFGEDELYKKISQLSCVCSGYLETTDKPESRVIHHLPNEQITITYQVETAKERKHYASPFIEKDYFLFFGNSLFVIPQIKEGSAFLRYENFPSDWVFINSLGPQPVLSFHKLKYAVYLGGNFKILKCGAVSIAVKKEWQFPEKRLLHVVETVIQTQRTFWNDFDFPHFLVTILPIEEDHLQFGTVVPNALSVFIKNTPFKNEHNSLWKWLEQRISHEHFHLWNAMKIQFDPKEDYTRWFMEGFTDYYADLLNFRAGLMTPSEYSDAIHKTVDEYNKSPKLNATDKEIRELFWKDSYIRRQPYLRGRLLALKWDTQLQKASDNIRSLDDVMRALLKEENLFSTERLKEFLKEYIPEADLDIEKYIIQGETLAPLS